jgi:hypothetical protein
MWELFYLDLIKYKKKRKVYCIEVFLDIVVYEYIYINKSTYIDIKFGSV